MAVRPALTLVDVAALPDDVLDALDRRLEQRRRARGASTRTARPSRQAPSGYDLSGWPEILPLLGMTEPTARLRVKRENDPAPIDTWCGRPIAKRAQLEAWVARQRAAASP